MKITKTKKGLFRARVYVGRDENNKPVQRVFTDIDKARLRLTISQYLDEHRDGFDRRKFGNAMDQYIEIRKSILSPNTIYSYKNIAAALKEHYPVFCALTVDEIRKSQLQPVINNLSESGKSPKTIRNYLGLISAVLQTHGYRIPLVSLPAREKHDYYVPDPDTMQRVAAAAAGTEWEIPIALGMMGMRRSEICAVEASDLNKNMLHIQRAAVKKDGVWTTKAPKTYESDRYIQLPADVAKKIRKNGRATDMTPAQISYRFAPFLKRNGFQHFRFHDLRHFFASYCHNVLKLSDAQIQKMGGWRTDHVMKSVYVQSMNDKQAGMLVANKIQKIIG